MSLHQHPRPLNPRVELDQQPPWIQHSWLLPGDFKCRPGGFDTTLLTWIYLSSQVKTGLIKASQTVQAEM